MVEREDIEDVAENARLTLSTDEVEALRDDVQDILDSFEALDDIDTDGVDPAFHPIEHGDRARDDEREDCLDQEEALSNAENKENGYFKGPRAVE